MGSRTEGVYEHSESAVLPLPFLTLLHGVGTAGSDCREEGEVTLSVAGLKGKAEGRPVLTVLFGSLCVNCPLPPLSTQRGTVGFSIDFKNPLPENTRDLA